MSSARLLPLLGIAAMCGAPMAARAQVQTTRIAYHRYVVPVGAVPGPTGPVATLAFRCQRDASPPYGPTHCAPVREPVLDHDGGILAPIAECAGSPLAATAEVRRIVRAALEASTVGDATITITLPEGTPTLVVLVRWNDVYVTQRCVRWGPCVTIDCHMGGPGRTCVEQVPHHVRDTTLVWGVVRGGVLEMHDSPPFIAMDVGVDRIVSIDARTVDGAAADDADPVVRFAAAIDLAIDALVRGDDEEGARATARAREASSAALAAASPADREVLSTCLRMLESATRPDTHQRQTPLCAP